MGTERYCAGPLHHRCKLVECILSRWAGGDTPDALERDYDLCAGTLDALRGPDASAALPPPERCSSCSPTTGHCAEPVRRGCVAGSRAALTPARPEKAEPR